MFSSISKTVFIIFSKVIDYRQAVLLYVKMHIFCNIILKIPVVYPITMYNYYFIRYVTPVVILG